MTLQLDLIRRFYNNNTNRDTGTFTFANTAAFLAGNANGFTATLGDVSTALLLCAPTLAAQLPSATVDESTLKRANVLPCRASPALKARP